MAGCSSPFVGAHPKHTIDFTQTRGPQTDTIAQNAARRLQLAPPDNPRPTICTIAIGDDGEPTPASLAACAALGHQLRPLKPAFKPPEGAKERALQRTQLPPEEAAPEYITIHADQFAGVGATVDRFSQLQPRPALLERAWIQFADGDAANSHVQLLLRSGDDQTAGLQSNDLDIFTYPDQVVGSVIATGNGTGQYEIQFTQPITSVPYLFHFRAINVGGATPVHVTWVLTLRIITPSEINRYRPTHLNEAAQIGSYAHMPLPPTRSRIRFPGGEKQPTESNYAKIELLAQTLRENPFGVPHAQMIAKAQEAGFGLNAERAVGLAITQAAKPPNIALLASRL